MIRAKTTVASLELTTRVTDLRAGGDDVVDDVVVNVMGCADDNVFHHSPRDSVSLGLRSKCQRETIVGGDCQDLGCYIHCH